MSSQQLASRRSVLAGVAGLGAVLGFGAAAGLAGCSGGPPQSGPSTTSGDGAFTPVTPSGDWTPAPRTVRGLRAVATVTGTKLALHTKGGDVTFWSGVNVGSTTPGHSPGELAIDRATYRRWFELMGQLGVRFVRIYTIHFPHCYEELRAYNLAHPKAPLYLVHGIYLPDESYLETGDLYATGPTEKMVAEVRDASAAVHGTLRRATRRGSAYGTWTADVSPWTAAWIVGVEWDPKATSASDATNAKAPHHAGRYFGSAKNATPTERWIAARMDELATYEAARGLSVPIAHANWPTVDPLRHPEEPLDREDLVGVDANHVVPTAAWPGGTFASYHAYPYYPDFQLIQPSYQQPVPGSSEPDPYRAYLADLQRHHAGMPVVISEFGVPASLGAAHLGSNGRDQGNHTEADAMGMDAAMLTMFKAQGLAGGLVFAWADEWFKFTWNTLPRHGAVDPERRALWHDPLTNEQYFGVLAQDPVRAGRRVIHEDRTGIQVVTLDHDASWVYLNLDLERAPDRPIELGFDIVPGGGLRLPGGAGDPVYDVAVTIDAAAGTARCLIRADLDPVLLDGLPRNALPPAERNGSGWTLQRLTLNAPRVVPSTRKALPAEFLDIGTLQRGRWDPGQGRDTLATWDFTPAGDGTPARVAVRLPWSMLAMSDPSSLTALVPTPEPGAARSQVAPTAKVTYRPVGVVIGEIGLLVEAPGVGSVRVPIRWEGWNRAQATERVKDGVLALVQAFVTTSG